MALSYLICPFLEGCPIYKLYSGKNEKGNNLKMDIIYRHINPNSDYSCLLLNSLKVVKDESIKTKKSDSLYEDDVNPNCALIKILNNTETQLI